MRKLYGLIALLMIITMVLTACGQQAGTDASVGETGEVEEVVMNPYLGSNKLDGNGVPKTFFDDVHIRKGFAYAFDCRNPIIQWGSRTIHSSSPARHAWI
jgi:predicted small secreted protein